MKTIEHDENSKKIMIKMDRVNVVYSNGTAALKDCSIDIPKGDFVFIVGSSGSGKSTFIKTLLGEVKTQSGKIIVEGQKITDLHKKKLPYYRRKLGVVFQEFRLLTDRSVYENICIAQRVIGTSKEHMKKNVLRMLEVVGLAKKAERYPNELSGGEQQRVAIARAMVNKPGILLADEPTGNLDPQNSWEIMKLLDEVNKLGTTVIVVTHNNEIVDKMKKRVVTLQNGEIISDVRSGGYVQ